MAARLNNFSSIIGLNKDVKFQLNGLVVSEIMFTELTVFHYVMGFVLYQIMEAKLFHKRWHDVLLG